MLRGAPIALSVLLLAGCGSGGSGSSSATSTATSSAPPPAPSPSPARPETEIARRFAPQLRFNAYFDDGSTSAQNRNEDFFPGDVDAWFASLALGRVALVSQMSIGAQPAVVQTFSNPQ